MTQIYVLTDIHIAVRRNEITEMPVTMIISGKISTLNVPAENENDTIRIKFQLLNVKLHNMCTYICDRI